MKQLCIDCGNEFGTWQTSKIRSVCLDCCIKRTNPSTSSSTNEAAPVHHSTEEKSDGGGMILLGLIVLAIGTAITFGTYEAAASSGGGRFLVAHGAIAGGVLLVLKGIWKSVTK